ncbi:MAG: hypothetical protein ABL889_21525 [Terricaulis sp.]
MSGLIRLLFAGAAGAVAFNLLPRAGLLASTQEIMALLSLMLAGLFPTMLLTATVLRAGKMSAKRIGEYGAALRAQMHFWIGLFLACLGGTLFVIVAKAFGAEGVASNLNIGSMHFTQDDFAGIALGCVGFCIGVVLQRLPAAYSGILSLLTLNVSMAQEEAAASDKQLADAFVRETTAAAANFKRVV